MKKRGWSSLITIVILIILILGAGVAIFFIVRDAVNENEEDRLLNNSNINLKISQVEKIDDNTLNLTVKMNEAPEVEELVALNFIVDDGVTTENIRINTSMSESDSESFSLNFIVLNASKVDKISITPIFRLKTGEEVLGVIEDEYITPNTCSNYCPLNAQCGFSGCGMKCGMDCAPGYFCLSYKCIKEKSSSGGGGGGGGGNACTDTCASLVYQCGIQNICGNAIVCGNCPTGYNCFSGLCIQNTTCTDTCSSLGYQCGTRTICGNSTNCGTCSTGYNCQSNGTCIKNITCTDTCSSLGYNCGIHNICGSNVNCGTCSTGLNGLLSETQDFIVPDDAPNGEYIGYVKAYPEFEIIGNAPTFKLKTNTDGIYAVSSTGLITISNKNALTTGEDVIVVTVSKIGYTDTDINVKINVLDADDCIFIDPMSATNGVGTRANPKNYPPAIVSNKNYLFKRETELTLNSEIQVATGKTNIIFGSYGIGDRPLLQIGSGERIIWIAYQCENITIRDLEGTTIEPDRSNPNIANKYNNWASCFFWESTTKTSFRVINCEMHHLYWGGQSNNAIGSTDNIEYKWNYVHDIAIDGLTMYGVGSLHAGVGYVVGNKIEKVQQAWYYSHSHSQTAGDGIQIENIHEVYVNHNHIDCSTVGGCAPIIVEGDLIEWVEIYNNYLVGDIAGNDPIDYEEAAYLISLQFNDGLIYNNTFIGSGPHTTAIYTQEADDGSGVNIYNNLFINLAGGIYGNIKSVYNNVFYGCGMNYPYPIEDHYILRNHYGTLPAFKNNIIYFTSPDQLVYVNYETVGADIDYNLYNTEHTSMFWVDYDNIADMQALGKELHSVVGNPLFVDPENNDFNLQSDSLAIDAGIDVGLSYLGTAPDIGAFESPYTNSTTPSPTGGYLRTFYVSNSGSDSNNGTTPSSPWKTIAKVNANTSFRPGDAILFKRGDVWREILAVPSSGNSTNYLVFGAYGSGDKPRIIGSEKATGWTAVSGYTNIWKSSTSLEDPYSWWLPAEIFFEENNGNVTWGNGKKNSINELSKEYDWTWSSNNIYVYSPANPNTRYFSVEIPQRMDIVSLNEKEYIEINGFDLSYSITGVSESEYPFEGYSGCVIRNCEISYIGSKWLGFDNPGYGTHVVYNDMLIENNEIHDCGRRGVSLNHYGDVDISNITVQNNVFYNGYHTTGVDVGTGSSSFSGNLDNIIIRNNLMYDKPDKSEADGSSLSELNWAQGPRQESGGTGKVSGYYFYNNTLMYPSMAGIALEDVSESYIFNNVFYGHDTQPGLGNTVYVSYGQQSTNAVIKNNIFYTELPFDANSAGVAIAAGMDNQDYQEMDVNHNLYYRINNNLRIIDRQSPQHWLVYYMSFASSEGGTLQEDTGWEMNGKTGNPLFVDAANRNFHVQAGSPAIDAGEIIPGYHCATSGQQNGCVVWYGSAPDIGKFEYQ